MAMKIEQAKKYLTNQSKSVQSIDILTEIYDKPSRYNETVIIAGEYIELKKYKGGMYYNNFKKRPDNSNEDRSIVQDNPSKEGQDPSTKNTSPQQRSNNNLYRSNYRRIQSIKYIIRSNQEIFKSLLTLTLGNRDYKEFLQNKITELPPQKDNNPVPSFYKELTTVLEKLTGVKSIDRCDPADSTRLNPEDNELRKEIVTYLGDVTNKKNRAESSVRKKYGDELETWRFNEQVKLELQRQLDNLICSKNPYDEKAAKSIFRNFSKKINRYLSDNYPEADGFKYIWILEFQENKKPHFHVLCNLPYIEQSVLQRKWNEGIVDIRPVKKIEIKNDNIIMRKEDEIEKNKLDDHYDKLIKYLTKNIQESSQELNLNGSQVYSISEKLYKPIKSTNAAEISYFRKKIKDNNLKYISKDNISSTNEYGLDFTLTTYNYGSSKLFLESQEKRRNLVSKMIEMAEAKGLDEITNEIFEIVMEKHGGGLEKEYLPHTR